MSEQREEVRDSIAAWLEYATTDLQAAETLLTSGLSGPACFHAQPAAEKALKAYLLWLGATSVPRTHDLGALSERIRRCGGSVPAEQALSHLSDYAVESRYPELPLPGHDEARAAVAVASDVLVWVRDAVR